MKLKHKVLIYNFIGFAILYIIFRFGLATLVDLSSLILSLIAAILASVLAPKFAVVNDTKMVMKWIFLKGFKEF